MVEEIKEIEYLGYGIRAVRPVMSDGSYGDIFWSIYDKGALILSDHSTIDGIYGFQSVSHAVNDAKKNVDSLVRTGNIKK